MADLIKENKDIKRKAAALNRYGKQAEGQAPTDMFAQKNRRDGVTFKKAPNHSYLSKVMKMMGM